jgi:DNA-binding transcriptional LysR family regulator
MTMVHGMIARTQYQLGAADLELVLGLVRGTSLAAAGERLGVDASTVFRSLQRIERGLGQPLFERTRAGYRPLELALALAAHAEQVEAQLDAARAAARQEPGAVTGSVRITTTDTVLHGLVAPALKALQAAHPLLAFELQAGNELANLARRDADIAVRATRRPPAHLVGRHVGAIRMALFTARSGPVQQLADVEAGRAVWIAPDDALPDHPTVGWRRRHFPRAAPTYRVNSIQSVAELVARGLGVGLLPLFLAQDRAELMPLTEPLEECQSELWLLAHPESRHLRRVATVFAHLAQGMRIP